MCKAWDDLLEDSYNKGAQEKEEEMKTIFDEMIEDSYNKGAQEKEEEMKSVYEAKEEEMKAIFDEMEKTAIKNMLSKFSVEEIIKMGYKESSVREVAIKM